MIAVLSDTHGREDARLVGSVAEAVDSAELVIHAGDFIREPVLRAFERRSAELVAVAGNVDDEAVRARLPPAVTLTIDGFRIALVHTVDGGETGLAMFGKERDADLVISGHTHRPTYRWTGEVGLLNPGSHAEPRGHRAGYAELEVEDNRLVGRLCEPEGETFEGFELVREGK